MCTDVKKFAYSKYRILQADFCACNDLFIAGFKYSEYLMLSCTVVGFVNTILSWPALIPLSRLTYAAYLVHPVVLSYYAFTLEDRMFISDVTYVRNPKYTLFQLLVCGPSFVRDASRSPVNLSCR